MSDKRTDRRRCTGLLFQTALCWTLIGLCCAGPRPADRGQRTRYTRHHDRWFQGIQIPSHHGQGTQRIEFPSVNDEGTQRVRYPSVNDGQAVRYPLVNDSGASSQIQKCAPGYYRDRSGPFLGRCVRCDCNGLSDECEERTGRCLGCQYNTAGDQCERCKEGYYGNAAQRTCRVCPCPLRSNSFAIGCKEVFGDFECVCRAGYTGDRCERCAPGYYGDPSTQGGSCRPCKCNGNYCDHRTGVCKSPLEPEDTNTDDHCQECDNCAQTLLFDLEKLDGELLKIKTQLTNASASATSQDRLKKLEKAVADTKILVNRFSSAINSQKSRVNQLEEDVSNLSDDISTLRDEAGKSAAQADKAVADVANTQTRAKDLDSEIQKMLKKIQALLDQLKDAGTGGGVVPNENLAKMLEEAQRLVKEMNERNFTPQKTAAAKERDEAEKLLDFIKANVSKQSDQNEAQAQNLGGLLKDYEAKLKDLEKALKEASDLLKKANTQNGLSAPALEDLKKRIKGLKMERDTVQGQITLAEKELQKTEDLAKMLSKSKEEYEQLAAQMDGAKTDLTKKVKEITEAASKKDLVEAAEDHANNLSKLAKELESAVANATGQTEVRNAKDAIDAYRNITDAINAAEAAANEAQSAADVTLNDLKKHKLTVRAKDLKETSEDLLKNAQEAETNLQDTADDITDLKNRLKDAAQKKTALQRDLADAQNQLNGIDRDGVSATIDEAKRKAASANNSATATMDRLNAIRGELEKIKVTPVDSNLNLALNDVDETVKNLLKTIPSLDDKLSEMENLTSEFPPMSNISENIYKIKDLIEQARDAANRIGIPMMFKGESHVELRAPKNLEDLKAYTSLMLSLQRPLGRGDGRRRRRQAPVSGNMFVLYLGNRDSSKNYIGMALKNEVLFAVYKLNGVEYKMETGIITKSVSVPAKFDIVDLRRIYQDAKMTLTKFTNSKTVFDPMTAKSQGEEDKNLLDLSPSDIVFYVGGYPDDFTPPASLNYPKYEGCIEFSSVNDKVVSLYNFRNAVNINPEPPCKRYVPRMDTDFYEGTGYGKVLLEPKRPVLLINMIVSSRSSNGLLLYIESEDAYITATIEKGVIFLRSNLLQTPATLNIKSFPTSDFKQFSMIILPNGDVSVRISSIEVAKANARFNFDGFKECYIGGAPKDVRERYNITMQPFKGCVKNLKQNSDVKSVSEPVGISKGCPKDSLVVRKADFSTGGTLSGDLTDFSLANDVVVSLGFKSTQNEGVILHDTQRDNGIQLALQSGHVILSFNKEIWKSNKQYQDGKWHYLTATRRNGRANLLIDDDDAGQEVSGSTSVPDTSGLLILGKDNFKGCVTNLYTRRPAKLFEAEDLNDFVASGDVLLDVCSADTLAQLMLDRSMKDVAKQATNETKSACALPATIQKAYRMGGPVSSLSYSLPLQALPLRPHFSLDVRTRASEGLLFFAATRGGRSHLALYISKGRIRLSVAKEKEIFNREKYNDGKWHSVIFSLEKKKFRLVVDGIRAQDGQLTNAELTSMQHLVSPVYLGSAPESLHRELKLKALPKQSVSGCIRNFKKNGAPMLNPTTNHGAGPCFEGQTQRGAYFAGNGSRVLLNDSFILGSSFELLFDIRPRSPTGLLLHVGELRWNQHGAMGHYLTVYMLRGEVVAQANNGKGEFKVSVKPKDSLCDETFHKISVIKRKNVVQLHVDTMDHYKIGPPSPVIPLTKDSLYVGGIPEMATQQKLPVTSSFVGCIQDMRVNGDSVSFDRPPAVFGPVNLKECPG